MLLLFLLTVHAIFVLSLLGKETIKVHFCVFCFLFTKHSLNKEHKVQESCKTYKRTTKKKIKINPKL